MENKVNEENYFGETAEYWQAERRIKAEKNRIIAMKIIELCGGGIL